MELLDLPLEILDEIIELTLPNGIEAFALCCKSVHARAASQILRHNSLKKRWKCTTVSNGRRGMVHSLLYEICRDALAGQYVESLSLCDLSRNLYGREYGSPLTHEALHSIRERIMDSEYFEKAGVDADEWWEEMLKENAGVNEDQDAGDEGALYTTVSLLFELPNLKTLRLPGGWYSRSRQWDEKKQEEKRLLLVLDAMVKCSNDSNVGGKALGKLEFILPSMEGGYEERAPLQCLEPLMILKSLKELYAVSCLAVDDRYTGLPFHWRMPEMSSALTRLELRHSCMDEDGISILLAHTPCLSILRYSQQAKWHGCLHDWNAGAFVETIARHCGGTITDLAITLDEFYGDMINGASSFCSFLNLQRLEIDLRICYGPPIGSDQKQGICAVLPKGETPWSVQDIPQLEDMLPDCIVGVQVNTDFSEQDQIAMEILFKNTPTERRSRLENLNKVIVRQFRGDNARNFAERTHVELDVFDPDVDQRTSRNMMPAWARNFERRVEELGLCQLVS